MTARDVTIVRRLKVAKEKEGDDYPSLSWRNGLTVCVIFFELNVVILPKVLNPRTLLRVMGVVKSID